MLTKEDWELWKKITKHDKKLVPEEVFEALIEVAAAPADAPLPKFKIPKKQMHKALFSNLREGDLTGLDANNATKLKRGKYAIDATLDLHGYTQAEALKSLIKCIKKTAERKGRCVLVITGKGRKNALDTTIEPGILKQMLPVWINHHDIRPHVLAFSGASAAHGGGGAFYILLKRKREVI